MQNTPNFNLPYPEGTDIYNPLTYEPVAMPIIDEAMQDNKVHTVQVAEHNKQGNNHALTREVVDADVFYFIAADDFVDGDTFTVDGNTVTARLSNGQNLQNDAFKINSAVLCILKNTILTVITFNRPIVDAQLSAESSNPVQNKVLAVPISALNLAVENLNTSLDEAKTDITNISTRLDTKLAYDDISIVSQTIGPEGRTLDLSALDSRLTTANYKRVDVNLRDQNNVGAYAIASACISNNKWYLRAVASSGAFFVLNLRCWK